MKQFSNLLEVIMHFSDKQVATDYLIQMRWGGNVCCAYCRHDKVYKLQGKFPRFKCAKCRGQFSATKGTIFENSPIPLQKWFAALYLLTAHKKGISSHQLARDLSVSQKSAWFMLQRLRFVFQSGSFNYSPGSILQVDETFVGGKAANKHQSGKARQKRKSERRADGANEMLGHGLYEKTPVIGMLETGGKVIANTIPNVKGKTLMNFVHSHALIGETIVTDDYNPYRRLNYHFDHKTVRHAMGQYVNDGFHTNGIENFWSLLKRGIIGIYHHVSDKHLDKYVDEFEFRFNTRKQGEVERFQNSLSLCERRLTYKALVNGEESGNTTSTKAND